MSRIKAENLEDFLKSKKECFVIKTTTYLKGSVKNSFINDCIKREMNESKLAAYIIDSYYSIIREHPFLIEKEMTEIKKYIIDKIKL